MTNQLIRNSETTEVPATPYVPYAPAYWYAHPVWGTPVGGGWAMSGGAAVSPGKIPSSGKIVNYGSSGTGGSIGGSPQTGQEIIGYELVFVPEQLEQPGSAGGLVPTVPVGWNSFARSAEGIPSGYAEFKVPHAAGGIVIGLAEFAAPTSGYAHIKHGLLFDLDGVRNAATGESYGAYDSDDVFRIVVDIEVHYLRNGVEMDSEAKTLRPEPLYLSAVLYSPGDAVDSPVLHSEVYGGGDTLLPGLVALGSGEAFGEGSTLLPGFVVDGGTGVYGFTTIGPLFTFGADQMRAEGASTLPPLVVTGYGGMLSGSVSPGGNTTMPGFFTSGLSHTGATGGGDTLLRAPVTLGADYEYAGGATLLPQLTTYGFGDDIAEALAFETLGVRASTSASSIVVVTAIQGVTIGATVVASQLFEGVAKASVGVQSTLTAEQILEAVARTLVRAGSTSIMEGLTGRADQDTIVWHEIGGSTMYRGYPFNSYAEIGGLYYGASEDGLFLLDGATDDGEPIHAAADLGRLNFGTSQKKTVSQAYLGMAADGNLVLKIIAEDREYLYRTRDFSLDMQQQRITLGKGLRTNYVTVQFFNENGADFELDMVQFIVADLTRRI